MLRGEKRVLAFPDLRPNRPVVRQGESLARTVLEADVRSPEEIRSRMNLLLAASFARAQRQGTLVDGLQFDVTAFNTLGRALSARPAGLSREGWGSIACIRYPRFSRLSSWDRSRCLKSAVSLGNSIPLRFRSAIF